MLTGFYLCVSLSLSLFLLVNDSFGEEEKKNVCCFDVFLVAL